MEPEERDPIENSNARNDDVESDTLSEPISATLLRDLKKIWSKLSFVIVPRKQEKRQLQNWDLWGPLLFCLLLAVILSSAAGTADSTGKDQSALVFASVFVIVWAGAGVVALNTKLLGGHVSFFQCVCVLGYCLFPQLLASLIILILSLFLQSGGAALIVTKSMLVCASMAWSISATLGFLSEAVDRNRRTLAVYPVLLFYIVLGWNVWIM
mmetsp:Transcript_44307/g.115144  ORF Transcript_44307/g.115144 Transcript_44307/m.115144 type:complete len:211 (-) Transcript_44307:761-1393(-)